MKTMMMGSMNIDYVYQVDHFVQPGETIRVHSRQVMCGGKGLNQAVALAKAGLDVSAAGFAGTGGEVLIRALAENDVRTEYIEQLDQPNGHTIIQVDTHGNNCILYDPSTNEMFTEEKIDAWLALLDGNDVLILQNETNLVPYMIDAAYAKGIRVSFNPSPVSADIRAYPLGKCTWLFINETEGEMISGCTDPAAILDFFGRQYPDTGVILTLGEDGAWYSGRDGRFFHRAFPVNAVDTTGAGDTFTGYFLQAALAGSGREKALEQACAAAALSVTRPGAAQAIPRMQEVCDFLARQ